MWWIISFVVVMAIVVYSLCVAASDADDRAEQMYQEKCKSKERSKE